MQRTKALDYLWVAPVVLVITLLMLFPLVRTFWLSMQQQRLGGEATFVGLKNYIEIVNTGAFFGAFWRTLKFTAPAIGFKLLLGMIAALILNGNFWGRDLLRSWLFIPWTIPLFAGAILFIWIFRMGGGLNLILQRFGMAPVFWLGPTLAMPAVITLNVYKGFPFFMIAILGGLQVISQDYYDAASIDGASEVQQFWFVTLPHIRDVALIACILSTIWTFAQFENIYVMTGGGPGDATKVLSITVYEAAFGRYNMPQGSAIAITALPFFLILILTLVRLVRKEAV